MRIRVASLSSNARLTQKIKKIALYNAINHNGKAKVDPVIGKLLAEEPDLKAQINVIQIHSSIYV